MEALTAALAASEATPDVGEHTQPLLAAIVESSDDAIVSKNLEGIIQSWNAGAERLFGYTADEVVGKSITILLPSPNPEEELRILSRIRRGEPVEHYETIRRRKDGSLVDISLTVSPVRDAAGRVVGASKIARNISERKRAEQALAKRAEEQAALYAFTDRLHRAQSTEGVYEAALDTIRRAFDCERASILIFAESGRMEFVAWRGLSEAYRRAVEGHSPWKIDAKDPEPICINNIGDAELPPALQATVKAEGIGALAFVPIVTNGRLLGKFMMYRSVPHNFGSDEVSLALNIARQLGFSLERMRIERARRGAEEALRES
jgi:PAS domain S-box-containing protein